jgi:ubiquinol-cytochrome c reductase cytochrome c1 subunit
VKAAEAVPAPEEVAATEAEEAPVVALEPAPADGIAEAALAEAAVAPEIAPTAASEASTQAASDKPVERTPSETDSVLGKAASSDEPALGASAPAAPEASPEASPEGTASAAQAAPEVLAAPAGPAFDAGAAMAALSAKSGEVEACVPAGTPRTKVPAQVTFAPSGRATLAVIMDGPLMGTAAGGCIAKALRGAQMPAFAGDRKVVGRTFRVGSD